MITDLRTAGSELLRATGCEPGQANAMVRRAAGAGEAALRPPVRMSRSHRRTPPARQRRRASAR
ncbi:hypothetical protein [Micromonospora endolithica]|uniref:hypothetical protein n=1 Tax=Micromonospora endolithica TaxID=230091 RepID=UPI001EDE549F|nr:hypothetical protein [Micromonospora endolithica]